MEKKLYYTKRSLCNGQIPNTPDYIKEDGYFLLVDRGECSFVEKVRNAQKDGASAVFIADDRCICSAEGLCNHDANMDCEKTEPIMDDDGSGSDVRIPSMLLLKPDADKLRDEIVSGTIIETRISFPVPKAIGGRTEYMLFTTPDDLASQQFLGSFLEAAMSFGTKAVFRPRMLLADGAQKGCRQYDESHAPCKGYCTNYGRYCETTSIYDQEHYQDKGTKMIVESMRRTCIWNIYGKLDGIGKEWWAYVQLWTLQCSFSHYSTSCAESVFDIAGVDKEEVEMCMENSGSFREDVLNTLMETSLSDIAKYNVKFAPTLVVNGAVITGALTFGNAMKAICSTFEDSERPEICSKWEICSEVCSKDGTCILWGENQECSEYRAPRLGNEGKVFDDDYLTFDVFDEVAMPTKSSNLDLVPSVDIETKVPIEGDLILEVHNVGMTNPPLPFDGATVSNTGHKIKINNDQSTYPHDGQHEFAETIQIYEGSNSDLAVGLGVGFGCAILLVIVWLLVTREREHRLEDLIDSGRISRTSLLRARERKFSRYFDQSTTSREINDNFSDEIDYYSDEEEPKIYYDTRRYKSKRRERGQLFPKKFRNKARMIRLQESSFPDNSKEVNEVEPQYNVGKARSNPKTIINDEGAPNSYEGRNHNRLPRKHSRKSNFGGSNSGYHDSDRSNA